VKSEGFENIIYFLFFVYQQFTDLANDSLMTALLLNVMFMTLKKILVHQKLMLCYL